VPSAFMPLATSSSEKIMRPGFQFDRTPPSGSFSSRLSVA
jgi:hypothetical protein